MIDCEEREELLKVVRLIDAGCNVEAVVEGCDGYKGGGGRQRVIVTFFSNRGSTAPPLPFF